MPKLNKLQKVISEYTAKHEKFSRVVSDDLIKSIGVKTDPSEVTAIVKRVMNKHGVKSDVYSQFMNYVITAVEVGAGTPIKGVNSFKRWYLENAVSLDGSKFSSKINDLSRATEITKDIKTSIKAGSSWRKAAQDLQERGIQNADVAKDIQGVLKEARKVYGLTNDSEAYQAYQAQVRTVKRRIEKLVNPDRSTLKRAYQNILDITNKSSAAQIESAVKYSAYYKERYNAERIARTEMGKAYGDAAFSDAAYDEDAIGIQFVLSSGHPVEDQCDLITGSDLYGMGAGVYPKDHLPDFPFHPSCLCVADKVYIGETKAATAKDYDPKRGEKYMKSLSKAEQESIMGVGGRERFIEKPSSWREQINGWNDPKKVKSENLIPKDKLYGK